MGMNHFITFNSKENAFQYNMKIYLRGTSLYKFIIYLLWAEDIGRLFKTEMSSRSFPW